MGRLLDTNVLLRVLCDEQEHPRYHDAVQFLREGGTVVNYVMPEIVFNFCAHERDLNAFKYAQSHGELEQYQRSPKAYSRAVAVPPGFRIEVYTTIRDAMNQLLFDYPNVTIDQKDLYDAAIDIACATGHDWVDCMLLSEKALKGAEVCSLDKDLSTVIDLAQIRKDNKSATTASPPQPAESSEPAREPEAVTCSSASDEGKKGKGVSKMSLM